MNKTICKIPIKNPDLTIKTVDIACNLIDTKESKIQIEKFTFIDLQRCARFDETLQLSKVFEKRLSFC